MSDVKKYGCCTLCDTEVYEIKTYFPEGPLHGFPRKTGRPLPSAWRIDYVLADGSHASLTSCESCLANMKDPANFPSLWAKVMRSFLFEEYPEVRAALPANARTIAEQEHIFNELTTLSQKVPIGVISSTRWIDLLT